MSRLACDGYMSGCPRAGVLAAGRLAWRLRALAAVWSAQGQRPADAQSAEAQGQRPADARPAAAPMAAANRAGASSGEK